MKRGIATLFFVFASFFLAAQQTVSGRVTDAESGGGLIGAHVYLLNNWRKGAVADLEGRFTLELAVEELTDSLIVSYVGFQEVVVPVMNGISIDLKPIEKEGETVVVTAKPLIAEEFKYMEIRKIDIYTNPSAKADPLLAVNSLPSSTTTDESANISLRGSSPIETGVFLNNVPIYDGIRYSQLNGIGTFSIFNTSIIQNVTVFPGNPPLEFGNATSGIISMQTDERVLEGSTNSLILSLANVGFSREQNLNKKQSLKLFTNWQPSGPIKLLNEKSLEDIESFTSNDLGLYWYGSDENLIWKILSYSVTEGYEFNFEHPTYKGIFEQQKNRSFLISSLEKPIGKGRLSINNGMSYSVGDYAYSNVAFEVKKKDLFAGINYIITRQNFSLKTGVSYDFRNAQVNGNYHEYFYALGPNHPTESLNENVDIKTTEWFGYFKYFLTENIALGTGLRKNIPIANGQHYLSKQINFSYTEEEWTVTIGAGVYHKLGLFENTGEPFEAKNAQKSIDINRKEKGLELALSIFDKKGEVNDIKYNARGMELFTDYRFSSKLRMSASLTLLDANDETEASYSYDLSYFARGNVSYSPGRLWTIESILAARQGSSFSDVSSVNFDSEQNAYEPIYSSEEVRLPAYANIGLSVSKVFAISDEWNIIAFGSINNILDRENIRGFAYNFDYSEKEKNFFSQRTGYLGAVINF